MLSERDLRNAYSESDRQAAAGDVTGAETIYPRAVAEIAAALASPNLSDADALAALGLAAEISVGPVGETLAGALALVERAGGDDGAGNEGAPRLALIIACRPILKICRHHRFDRAAAGGEPFAVLSRISEKCPAVFGQKSC